MAENLNTISKELFSQFEWFNRAFSTPAQAASDDFLYRGIEFKFLSLSKNMNALFKEDSYFVTKIKVDAENEVFLRNSDKAVQVILDRAIGKADKKFDINKITELEAKIITAFNDNLYNFISQSFAIPPEAPSTYDTIHLTFLIRDIDSNVNGKIIVSFPSYLTDLIVVSVESQKDKFYLESFLNSPVGVNIKVGRTKFTVKDLKMLDVDDIVLLEDSNIQSMHLKYLDYEKDFRIAPNPALIMSVDNSEGEDMAGISPDNLWDSIKVEIGAEFDKVQITLGELKNIEEGLVVDIGSVYKNNITLKIEDKIIATGELVIINDRYGVKIGRIYADEAPAKPQPQVMMHQPEDEQFVPQEAPPQDFEPIGESMPEQGQMNEDQEDFDYSDFELEDEDI